MSTSGNQSTGQLQIGTRLAQHYIVQEPIGFGGMALVYRGVHAKTHRAVAIKVLRPEITDPSTTVRFLLETRAASKVRHPCVVEVIDYGKLDDERPFMIMEYLEGDDLDAMLRVHGRLLWYRVSRILLHVLAALQAAHDAGVIHRDIKPANVFCLRGREDVVKVLDFGIAKIMEGGGSPDQSLTTEGDVLGTPTYMAPEQCEGSSQVDARADLYSAGTIAYEMLTGRPPFPPCSSPGIVIYHQLKTPVPPMPMLLPSGVEAVIRRALSKKRDDRYGSAREFAAAVRATMDEDPSKLPELVGLFE